MQFSEIFSQESIKNLMQCEPALQKVINRAAHTGLVDFGVTTGHRSEEEQNRLYQNGKSKVRYPDSKHNSKPSKAADLAVWLPRKGEYSWEEPHYAFLAGVVMACAAELGISIRWGGNWDQDLEVITDQDFDDLAHFELKT